MQPKEGSYIIELRYEKPKLNGELSCQVSAFDTDLKCVVYSARVDLRNTDSRHVYARSLAAQLGQTELCLATEEQLNEKASEYAATAPGPVLHLLSSVKPRPVNWLWPDRIARGKLTIIAGDPGTGKSMMSVDLAARISTGSPWPDDVFGDRRRPGNVVMLNAEDDPEDTIRPRCDSAGADADRITIMEGVRCTGSDGAARVRQFTLDDVYNLDKAIGPDTHAVIVDPVSAYLGDVDSHKNAEVRGLLTPLSELARKHACAIIVITHLAKASGGPAMYRASGSLAFVAAARAAYAVAKDPQDPARRLFVPIKNNVGNDTDGLAYRIVDKLGNKAVEWERDKIQVNADELLGAGAKTSGEDGDQIDAEKWLADSLMLGSVESKVLVQRAKREGISERTLWRAKKVLGVTAGRIGFGSNGQWVWTMPSSDPIPCHDPTSVADLAAFGVSRDPIDDIP